MDDETGTVLAADAFAESSGNEPAPGADSVKFSFQFSYAIRLTVAVMAGAIVASATAYLFLAKDLQGYAHNITLMSAGRESVTGVVIVSALIQILLSGTMLILIALFASHKIAGPTCRVVRLLHDVRQGRLPGRVRFRRSDQVGKLETEFNKLSHTLAERHTHLTGSLEQVRIAEEELRSALAKPGDVEECRAAAARLRRQAAELAQALDRARSESM